jgi:hypothetical protein
VQDVDPLTLIRAIIDPVIAIPRRRRPALIEDLLCRLSNILIIADGGIATGNGPGVHGCGEQQSRASEDKKVMDFHGDFSRCLLSAERYEGLSTAKSFYPNREHALSFYT